MSEKIEALKLAKEYVDERKQIQFDYIQVKEDGYVSYDVVGYIAHTLGIPDEVLCMLNGDEIGSEEFFTKSFRDQLIAYGFITEELIELQELNDLPNSSETLIAYIDELIEEEA